VEPSAVRLRSRPDGSPPFAVAALHALCRGAGRRAERRGGAAAPACIEHRAPQEAAASRRFGQCACHNRRTGLSAPVSEILRVRSRATNEAGVDREGGPSAARPLSRVRPIRSNPGTPVVALGGSKPPARLGQRSKRPALAGKRPPAALGTGQLDETFWFCQRRTNSREARTAFQRTSCAVMH